MKDKLSNEKIIRVTVFFCDIIGTIDGDINDEECKKFADLLDKLRKINNSDLLLFSISSTEQSNIVSYYEKKLSKYFNNNVMVMEKIEVDKTISDAKIANALLYIEYLQKEYEVAGVYCADDIAILQEMFANLLCKLFGIELITIITKHGENNLEFINKEIEKRFINNKIKYK